ncbi:MAG: M4 family metallopeptidase [Acidobacteria bacterium]|nr:M4 family metallopeptidase [Acidobacteriota bacterium]
MGDLAGSARDFVKSRTDLFASAGREDVVVTRVEHDDLGKVHVRMQETINGLQVVGGDMIVHADATSGDIYGVSGRFVSDSKLPRRAKIEATVALKEAIGALGIKEYSFLSDAELTYVVGETGKTYLAWAARVSYTSDQGPEIDVVFADARSGILVARHPEIHRALNRKTYTANHGTSLPGTLLFNEGGSSSDAAANAAYTNAGYTYNFYSSVFGRDSYNGSGAQIISTVHYSSNYNNAYWNSSQMVYGDGDGSVFSYLSGALDVVAHELTHAVTEYSANLVYQNESGALNESMSDIMGCSAEAWVDGGVSANTWKLGEDVYTPGTSGDALRYMNDPAADGGSRDYYPDRYTGTSDNGGVHSNSGISNLAFYLLSQGGTHPRGKTSVNVPAIGITKARAIFYRALTVYMTSSTNFQGARNATASAATDLYGSTEVAAVQAAWDAVGVPGGGGGGGGGTTALTNGVPVTGISGSSGSETFFSIAVPSGASNLVISISGGSGDADLYTRFGSQPTTGSYLCRPYLSGNNETCTVASPSTGTYYIMLRGYSAYSGVTLVASYTTGGGGGGGAPCTGCTAYSGSLSGSGSSQYQPNGTYYYSSSSGNHHGWLQGPSGTDFDLYLQKWNGSSWSNVASSLSSSSTEEISYNGTSGYYRWRVYSYSGSGSYNFWLTHP